MSQLAAEALAWARGDHLGRALALFILAFVANWIRERHVPRLKPHRRLAVLPCAAANAAAAPVLSAALSAALAYLTAALADAPFASVQHLWRQAVAAGIIAVAVTWAGGAGRALGQPSR